MMNVMNVKCKFTIDEVINLTENCYYVTADDVVDLCDLREIGFENVRWVKDIFEEFGGCWIAEKIEHEVDGDKHGGMLVCLSVRVGRMLDEYCKNNGEVRDRDKVEELMLAKCERFVQSTKMYELNAALDSWNGKGRVNRIILLLESLVDVFKEIKKKEKTGLL